MNAPDSAFLSAPLGLLTLLHLLTLTLHLLAMNFLLGGLGIAVFAAVKGRWEDPDLQRFAKLLPPAMAATVTLGVAPLLFLQMVYPRQVYSAAIVSGMWWLLVVVAVMAAYYALYRASHVAERTGRPGLAPWLLALAGLVYVSAAYTSVFSMAERPDLIRALYARTASGWAWNPPTLSMVLRWLHMLLGALTVGGFFVAWIGRDRGAIFALGRGCFLWGMLAAAIAGTAYLATLGPVLRPFMRTPAIWALTIAILLSAGALHLFLKQRFAAAAILLLLSTFGMVYARHVVRLLTLAGSFDPSSWRIAPHWPLVGLFLLCFLAMLGALAWMFKLASTAEGTD